MLMSTIRGGGYRLLMAYSLPVEVAGVALTGTSVLALIRQAVRP
jgi:hypothetical protein